MIWGTDSDPLNNVLSHLKEMRTRAHNLSVDVKKERNVQVLHLRVACLQSRVATRS